VTAIVGRPADGVDLDLAFPEVPVSVPSHTKGSDAWARRTALADNRILLCTSDGAAGQ